MIEYYDVEIDADGNGSNLTGTITILGHQHLLEMSGSGRDLMIELDGKLCPEELQEGLGEWTDAFEEVQEILNEIGEPYEIECWSGRIVNGKVVRLIIQNGRSLEVVRGTLTDDPVEE